MRKHLRLHRMSVLELEQLFAVALDAEVGLVGRGAKREGFQQQGRNRKPKAEGVHGMEWKTDGNYNVGRESTGTRDAWRQCYQEARQQNKSGGNNRGSGWNSGGWGIDGTPKKPHEDESNRGWGNSNWNNGSNKRKCFVCDKEGHSWVTYSDRKGGSGCARCGSSAHHIKSCPQRSSERVNSHQTDDSDPLMYMIEIKVMEVAGAPTGAKLLYYPLQIRQVWVKALLDSGASVNYIDADLVRSVGGCLAAKPPGNLLYPDKRKAIVKGTTKLEVRGPGYHEKVSFWVV